MEQMNEYEAKAYNEGALDYYYGRRPNENVLKLYTEKQRIAYWKGREDAPYGEKDFGYDPCDSWVG